MPDAYNAPGLSEAPSVPWALNAGREEVRPRGACSERVCGGPWGGARRGACPCGADQGTRHRRVTVLGQGACRAGPRRCMDVPGQGGGAAVRRGLGGRTLRWPSSPSRSWAAPTPASG